MIPYTLDQTILPKSVILADVPELLLPVEEPGSPDPALVSKHGHGIILPATSIDADLMDSDLTSIVIGASKGSG